MIIGSRRKGQIFMQRTDRAVRRAGEQESRRAGEQNRSQEGKKIYLHFRLR
jgi:hypothetical protein